MSSWYGGPDTAARDQVGAAHRESLAALTRWTVEHDVGFWTGPPGATLASWAEEAAVRAVRAGSLLACPHVGPSPHPLAGVWLEPGSPVIGCGPCVRAAVHASRAEDADHRCDRCGALVRAGEEWGARGALVLGPVTWALGLCVRCADALAVRRMVRP